MNRFLTICTGLISLSITLSIEYNCKISYKVSNYAYTFPDFRNAPGNESLISKLRYRMNFLGPVLYSRANGTEGSLTTGSLSFLSQEEDHLEPDSENGPIKISTETETGNKTGETLVFSDFSDLYKDIDLSQKHQGSEALTEDTEEETELSYLPETTDRDFSFDERSYSLSKRLFVRKLFKKVPEIVETKQFLMRSKAYVKGRVGSKCDLKMFDSNRVKTAEMREEPFESVKSILPGVFTGLHTIKHTKKRVIRELKVKLDLYVKALTSQLKNITHFYGELLKHIHPFQYNMLKTCLHEVQSTGRAQVSFDHLLSELKRAKKEIIFKGNEMNRQIDTIKRCRDAFNFVKANVFELDSIYSGFQPLYDHYLNYSSFLKALPVLDIEKPIISLIGHVNVGKTTLYNKLSQGLLLNKDFKNVTHIEIISDSLGLRWSNCKNTLKKPNKEGRVGNYKFTTRGINLSKLTYKVNNFIYEAQLVDTPGLLWRKGHSNFNPYEKLTYSVLKDLPSGVIFCFDLSDNNSLEDQIDLYLSLKSRFPQRPWINVVVQGGDREDKVRTLSEMGIEGLEPRECQSRIEPLCNSLHRTLNL